MAERVGLPPRDGERCSRLGCTRRATQDCPVSECAACGIHYCDVHAPEHAAWHAARHESALTGADGDAAVDALSAAWKYWRIEYRFPDLLDRAHARGLALNNDVLDLLSQKIVRDLAAVDRRRAEGRSDTHDVQVERDCELLVFALNRVQFPD